MRGGSSARERRKKKNWKNLLREIIRFDNVRDTLNRLKRSIEILYR